MSTIDTRIRPYQSEDHDSLIRFWEEVAELEPTPNQIVVRDLIDDLDRPNHSPELNVFVAEKKGIIIGYIDVISEKEIGRAIIQYLVHPAHRLKWIPEKLVETAVERAGKLSVKKVQVNIPEDDKAEKRLFAKMGFHFVRRFLELRLDLSKTHKSQFRWKDYPCRPMTDGEIEKLTKLQNRSFLDTWGFNPNTPEEISYRIRLPNASFEDITLCFDGNEPIAYCWSKINFDKGTFMDGQEGRIMMLGVDPDYQGKGLGKKVLMEGITRLKNRGVRFVDLTVDGENHVARTLYKSLGFELRARSLWYQKDLEI